MSARIAYLTGRAYRGVNIPSGTLPKLEQPNFERINAAGADAGVAFEIAYWDDADLPQRGYAGALIRSTWDYHQRLDEFVSRIGAHERAGLPVFNSAQIVQWNSRKTYLRDLGAAAIETLWTERIDADIVSRAFDALGAEDIVIKPQVGAGSVNAIRLKRNAWSEHDLAAGPKGPAMIQGFLRSIETEGEWSLIWFGDTFSHAVRKAPKPGDWRANIPGETRFTNEAPPKSAIATAEAAHDRAPRDLLYVRIDLVLDDNGAWRVIEIEAIEPHLFLDLAPSGARALVGALSRVLSL